MSWGMMGPGLFLGCPGTWKTALLTSMCLWPRRDGLTSWLDPRVLRIKDRWWAFIALLSIIGVLQELPAGNEKDEAACGFCPNLFGLGLHPKLGNHSN